MAFEVPIPHYTTPDLVSEALDLPNKKDPRRTFVFTSATHPSYDAVCRMIAANEDQIDRRLNQSWRPHYIKNKILDIPKYQHDESSWRSDYYQYGGYKVPLRQNILEWNPNPIVELVVDEGGEVITQAPPKYEGEDIYVHNYMGEPEVDEEGHTVYEQATAFHLEDSGEFTPIPKLLVFIPRADGGQSEEYATPPAVAAYKKVWDGDKLEVRDYSGMWRDISGGCTDNALASQTFTFDYNSGVLYLRTYVIQPKYNAVRISYRYGQPEGTEPPQAIQRLCTLMTAVQLLTAQFYDIKVGGGGDISGMREGMIQSWNTEMGSIWSSYQRIGRVYSMISR